MKTDRWFIGVLAFLTCLSGLTSCHDSALPDEEVLEMEPVPVNTRQVNFSVAVALAENSAPELSTEDVYPEGPTAECEKMHSLRVIVVRPNGVVEINRAVTLRAPGVKYDYEPFKVQGGETKKVYLFVNEATRREGNRGKLVDFDFSSLREGSELPAATLENLRISLDGDERLTGNLPMSECHEVYVPETDSEATLFVTRAAVKFTFHITNNGSLPFRLTGLTVGQMADTEYYLPRNAVYKDYISLDDIPFKDIISYEVPETVTYRTLDIFDAAGVEVPVEVGVKATYETVPVYHLEGLYKEAGSEICGYRVNLVAENPNSGEEPLRFSALLPNLPRLPRNTHVKVNIDLGDAGIKWQVDVRPYTSLELEPVFGL